MTESAIPGVRYLRHTRHEDSRGAFREIWRASAFRGGAAGGGAEGGGQGGRQGGGGGAEAGGNSGAAGPFVQANLSSSAAGVLRGLHFHRRQLDYWTVTAGAAFVALVDVRPLLGVGGDQAVVETRTLRRDDAVVIPAGVAHGFLALEPVELLYLVTTEYDGTDELGFAWDDPDVGVAWPQLDTPDGRPILSDRDRTNPTLAEAIARLRV